MNRHVARRASSYLPAAAFAGAYALLSIHAHIDPLRDLSSATKGSAYQTLAGIAGGVLGLGVVSFSVLFVVSPRSRLAAVIAYSPAIRVALTSSFIALGAAMVGFGVLLPIDHTDDATGSRFVAAGLVAVVAIALGQVIYLADRTFRTVSNQLASELNETSGDTAGFEVIPADRGARIPSYRARTLTAPGRPEPRH